MNLKTGILTLAKFSGLFALSRVVTARKVRILAYHGIWLGDGHFGNFLYMRGSTFARRMELLDKWRFPVVALSDVVSTANTRQLHKLSTVITIDDGWHSTFSVMLPILECFNYPATVYLTTYYCLNQSPVINVAIQYCFSNIDSQQCPVLHIPSQDFGPHTINTPMDIQHAMQSALAKIAPMSCDLERQLFLADLCEATGIDYNKLVSGRWFHLMSADEVADAAKQGITFELHTHHHRIAPEGKDCLDEELTVNRLNIIQLTGRNPTHFCYPSGIFSQAMWPTLELSDICSATTTETGLVDKGIHPYMLPRILDGEDVSELEFEAEMSGFLQLVRNLQSLLRL